MAEIIFTKKPTDSIHIDDIRIKKHIVVAKDSRDGNKSILTRTHFDKGKFYFLSLNDAVTRGNRYSELTSFKECISLMSIHGEVQAFETFEEAFKWLLDE